MLKNVPGDWNWLRPQIGKLKKPQKNQNKTTTTKIKNHSNSELLLFVEQDSNSKLLLFIKQYF